MRNVLSISVVFMFIFIIAGCGSADETEGETSTKAEETEETAITITHELGETEVHKNPEKVIVFDFGMLDTLDYLDVDVTGVPQMNIPSYLEKYSGDDYEDIGSLKEPDFEKIANIDPDLIIISGRQSDLYDELSELGPVIFLGVDTTRYMDSFIENTEIIGEIFDKEDEVEEELSNIDEQIAEINDKAEKADKNGLIILANDDKVSAYGQGSRFGLIHDVFGVPAVDEDIEASTHGMNISFEYVAEKDPDLLYVVDRSAAIGEESAAKNVVENELIKNTKAMQNDDIVYLNPDIWYLSGGGIISVQEMIQEISDSLD